VQQAAKKNNHKVHKEFTKFAKKKINFGYLQWYNCYLICIIYL